MDIKKTIFRILYGTVLFAASLLGLKSSIFLALFLEEQVGSILTLVLLILIAGLALLVFRAIRPRNKEIWNFEFQLMRIELVSLVLWYFLLLFMSVTIYMAITLLLFPFYR